jgi:hypothetical protein
MDGSFTLSSSLFSLLLLFVPEKTSWTLAFGLPEQEEWKISRSATGWKQESTVPTFSFLNEFRDELALVDEHRPDLLKKG